MQNFPPLFPPTFHSFPSSSEVQSSSRVESSRSTTIAVTVVATVAAVKALARLLSPTTSRGEEGETPQTCVHGARGVQLPRGRSPPRTYAFLAWQPMTPSARYALASSFLPSAGLLLLFFKFNKMHFFFSARFSLASSLLFSPISVQRPRPGK